MIEGVRSIDDVRHRKQAELLMRILPIVAQEKCFAMRGGTAINIFVRDMPRFACDVDLAFLPILGLDESLREIDESLKRIMKAVLDTIAESTVESSVLAGTEAVVRLVVNTPDAQIKVEASPPLREAVFPSEKRTVSERVETEFGAAEIAVVSFADLYGRTIVAALDRQHPRDLYDVRLLLADEGISRILFQTFLVYLIGHDRPMAEILAPTLRDIRHEFEYEFSGTTLEKITCDDLEYARKELIESIQASFTDADRKLLLSIMSGTPDWSLFRIHDVDKLPALRARVQSLQKLEPHERRSQQERLSDVLDKLIDQLT